jgi:D-alanyl-D-alanine carboxypeptidase
VKSERETVRREKRKRLIFKFFLFVFIVVFFGACLRKTGAQGSESSLENTQDEFNEFNFYTTTLANTLKNSGLPQSMQAKITEIAAGGQEFFNELLAILQGDDPYMWLLVDKKNALSSEYVPDDLIPLTNKSYRISRNDLSLRAAAEASLEEMAAAARAEGLTLLASSSYRSYAYQQQVYARNVREMGQIEADKVSAMPGHSQHQLGLVIDFGSITDEFADTREGKWLAENASRFGWSLSFPKGYEEITGYSWECWHYRYVGRELAAFINNYFDGVQQYALQFIHEWRKENDNF